MQICVLGPVEIRAATGVALAPHGVRQRKLLATLALHAPRMVSADRLIDVIWGDGPPTEPAAALRTQASRLRSLLREAGCEAWLQRGDTPGYALAVAPADTDAGVFEALLADAGRAATPAVALELLDRALELWRDEPYGELGVELHFAGEAARLQELRMSACEQRVQSLLALGRTTDALTAVGALVHRDPLRERSRALAMHALYQAGRAHEALASFQEFRRLLSEELGLAPSPAIRALESEILRHAPATLQPGAGHAVLEPPALHQDIRFTVASDGVRLAYATVGRGPPLIKAANWLNHLEFDWESPVWRRLFRELAARRLLIRYDERGSGLSDLDPADLSLDAWVLDLECIVDACGLERFPLLGISQGCAVCIEYAARHPHRVSALILHGGYAAGWRADPSYGEAEIARRDASIEIVRHGWGEDTPAYRQMFTQTFIPGGTADEIAWFNELQQRTTTPETAARFMEAFAQIDVRHRLASVQAPTLVLHSRGDQRIHYEKGRELAAGIRGARFVLLDSRNHLVLEHEPAFDDWITETFRFLAEAGA
jgi:DNA-binding SARP family transcriptional activator/pimeloyl-ACP methyl ester carboxylesterase